MLFIDTIIYILTQPLLISYIILFLLIIIQFYKNIKEILSDLKHLFLERMWYRYRIGTIVDDFSTKLQAYEGDEFSIEKHLKIRIVKLNEIEKDQKQWGVIKRLKNEDIEKTKERIIRQLPIIGFYKRERMIFPDKYQYAFTDALSLELAELENKDEIITQINKKAEDDGYKKQLEDMQYILADKEKRITMIEEARRRYNYAKSKKPFIITQQCKKEFGNIIKDLRNNKIGILRISPYSVQSVIVSETASILNSGQYDYVYLLAIKDKQIKKLNSAVIELIEKNKNFVIHDRQSNIWVDSEGGKIDSKFYVIKKKSRKKIPIK